MTFPNILHRNFWWAANIIRGNAEVRNNAEREDTGVSTAWLHHKGRNKHHYEHWVDYSINDPETCDHGGENAPQICGRDGDGRGQCLQDVSWGRI